MHSECATSTHKKHGRDLNPQPDGATTPPPKLYLTSITLASDSVFRNISFSATLYFLHLSTAHLLHLHCMFCLCTVCVCCHMYVRLHYVLTAVCRQWEMRINVLPTATMFSALIRTPVNTCTYTNNAGAYYLCHSLPPALSANPPTPINENLGSIKLLLTLIFRVLLNHCSSKTTLETLCVLPSNMPPFQILRCETAAPAVAGRWWRGTEVTV